MNMCQEGLEEEELDGPRHFQVNIVILEARHLAAANSNSKVIVSIGNRSKTIRSKTVKTDAPYFNDLCIFNFYLPLSVLLDEILNIKIYGVTKLRRNRLIGSFSVELATIWAQPNHQFYHKWAALTDSKNPAAGVKGYLKCDIGVLTQGTKSKTMALDHSENIEDNLLVPYGEVNDRQRAKFVFTIFRADNFSNYLSHQPLHSLYAYVRITYAGITGKTSVASNMFSPYWNEELSFTDVIPALCRYVHIEICDVYKTTSRGVLGTANLDLRRLSREGENGFLPTYGPAFLYLYQNFGKFDRHNKCCFVSSSFTYMCRLLIALRTEVVDYPEDVSAKNANMLVIKPKSITSLDENKYFEYEEFIFFAAVFDVLLFDANIVTSKLSIRVNIGPSKPIESDITLKPSTEIKSALKTKSDTNEDDNNDEKTSLKSKKTVTFENEDYSSRTSSDILNEVVLDTREKYEETPSSPEFSEPNVEATQPDSLKGKSQKFKAEETKPEKNSNNLPAAGHFQKKYTESSPRYKPKNWKIFNPTREWKPLKQIQKWPTDWREKRKNSASEHGVKASSEEELKPRKGIKLGRTLRGFQPIKSWPSKWSGIKGKKLVSNINKMDSPPEPESSTTNMNDTLIVANVSTEDDADISSKNSKFLPASEESEIIRLGASLKGSNHQQIRHKRTLRFAESLPLSKPFKSLQTWPTEWRAKMENKTSKNNEEERILGPDKDHILRRRRKLKDWLKNGATKYRAVSARKWDYWKKSQDIAVKLKEKTKKYTGRHSTIDSEEKDPVERNLLNAVETESEVSHQNTIAGKRGLKWKGSLKHWKTTKILQEWPSDWAKTKQKRSLTSSQDDTSGTNTVSEDEKRKIVYSERWEQRGTDWPSESSSTEPFSSSTETQDSRQHAKEFIKRRSKFRSKVARKSDILSQKVGNIFRNERGTKTKWKASRAKRKRRKRGSQASEAGLIFNPTEKRKSDGTRKVVNLLGEWPTEWRSRRPFHQRNSPETHRGRRKSKLRRLEEWMKKSSQFYHKEETGEKSQGLNSESSSEHNIEHPVSVLPVQTESLGSLPKKEIPISEYVSEDNISLDTSFIFNRLQKTDSGETFWSQRTVWSQEEVECEKLISQQPLMDKSQKVEEKVGDNTEAYKEKSTKELSEEPGGTFGTDSQPKTKEISFSLKGGEKDDWQPYRSITESSSLDESDTSSKAEEPPRRKFFQRKKRQGKTAAKISSESSIISDSEDDESFDSGSESSDNTSSSTSSEDESGSESREGRKCIFKKKPSDMNTQCDQCFREAIKSAKSKKRYWYRRNKRVPQARLFSPRNTTETNVKVYFAFQNDLLGFTRGSHRKENITNIKVNRSEEVSAEKLRKKESKMDTEKKRWKLWHRKSNKSKNSKEPGTEDRIKKGKRNENSHSNNKKSVQENDAHDVFEGEGSSSPLDESLSEDDEVKNETIWQRDIDTENITREAEKEESTSKEEEPIMKKEKQALKAEKDREPLGKKRRFWHKKTVKHEAENNRGHEDSSLDEETTLRGKYELENKTSKRDSLKTIAPPVKQRKRRFWHKRAVKDEAGNNRSHEDSSSDEETVLQNSDKYESERKRRRVLKAIGSLKQRKRRFWSGKNKTTPEPTKELKFAENDLIETKESQIEMTNEIKHVRIYNGCNTTVPQSVIIREHYGFTNFSGKYPCIHINGEWPNALRRTYRSNIVQKSIKNLKSGINDVENELADGNKIEASEKLKKIFQDLSEDCRETLSLTTKVESKDTNLYRERKRLYHREIKELIEKAEAVSQKNVVIAEHELKNAYSYLSTLQRYAQDPEDSFPDTEIWLIKDGKTVAQHRMRTQKIVFSPNVEERGVGSGRIQSIIVRGREGKEVAKLEIFMWFGLGNHFLQCRNMLPSGFEEELHKCRGTAIPDIPLLLSYEEVHYFECRVHLFQARILIGADTNGLADPFVRVIVLGHLKDSQVQKETLNPTWDETLVFPNLTLYGPVDYIKDNSLTITIEVIDYDYLSKNELIGRTLLKPVVKLNYEDYKPPKLTWEDVRKECNETGKILMTAELLQVSGVEPEKSDYQETTLPIPKDIRPYSVGHRLEVLFWGIRELKKTSPGASRVFVTLECGGKYLSSPILKNTKKGLNFPGTVQTLDLELPQDHNYKPPLILKLFQTNPLVPGYETYVGNCIVPSVKTFFCTAMDDQEKRQKERAFIELLAESKRAKKAEGSELLAKAKAKKREVRWKKLRSKLGDILESMVVILLKPFKTLKCKIRGSCADIERQHLLEYDDEETLDWWVKYYASKEHKSDVADHETLVIYEEELEAQPEFHGFSDFIYTFDMVTGKVKKNVESQILVGKVKAAVKLYRWPLEEGSYHTLYGVDIKKGVLKQLPSNLAIKYVARIYVVSCKNLTPKDLYGKSDPYLILQIGKQRINDEQNYIPKQVNPIFGRCFEFKGIFPKEHLLRIKVMDHDILTKDDLIGETFIDLESRYYTKHHASCGLPKTYSKTGFTAWRDAFKPTEILKTVCKQSNMAEPVYTSNGVRIGEYEFKAATENEKYADEMNALVALKKWHEIPLHGFHLVPEHIETRPLYHPSFPGVEQGKIEMWIDIFPADFRYIPPIVDINPRKPVAMELRAIIWNVEGVILNDTTLFFNEKMSDIYVQGWLTALEEDKQATDVHYRSMNGEGNFNWRFIFPFKYIAAEKRLVVHKKQNVLDSEPEEMKFPCRLELQVWDNDFFSDDFLGSLNLELSSMPRGAKISTRCKLNMFEESTPKINLFKIRRTRGWWPFRRIIDAESSEYSLAGKIDLELEVMTENEAKENPVGKGREEPKALPEPKRPESSFIWFFNPLKTCRYIICRKYGKYLLILLAIAMVVAFVLIGIYAFPGYAVKRMLGA